MILERPETCEGYSQTGNRCTRSAELLFETPGDALHLCPVHHKMLDSREPSTAELLLRRWRAMP